MTKTPNPKPFSMPPVTDDIDDLWAEVDFGESEPKKASTAPSDPFGLEAAPAAKPEVAPPLSEPPAPGPSLELDAAADSSEAAFDDVFGSPRLDAGFGSSREPVDEDGFGAEFGTPQPEKSRPRRSSRPTGRRPGAQTAPEPVVRRHVAQMGSSGDDRLDLRFGADAAADADGGAMALVEHAIPPSRDDVLEAESSAGGSGNPTDMQDRYAVGDFTGALVIAESILETDPEDEEALRYATSCREVLTKMYAARLGSLDRVAQVAIPPDQITWLSLDHRAGFLLSLVDGASTVEEILDISGMTRLEALRIMYTLVQQNVVNVA